MKASLVVSTLQRMIAWHGDADVFVEGTDHDGRYYGDIFLMYDKNPKDPELSDPVFVIGIGLE